jgi:hypothetical protein
MPHRRFCPYCVSSRGAISRWIMSCSPNDRQRHLVPVRELCESPCDLPDRPLKAARGRDPRGRRSFIVRHEAHKRVVLPARPTRGNVHRDRPDEVGPIPQSSADELSLRQVPFPSRCSAFKSRVVGDEPRGSERRDRRVVVHPEHKSLAGRAPGERIRTPQRRYPARPGRRCLVDTVLLYYSIIKCQRVMSPLR